LLGADCKPRDEVLVGVVGQSYQLTAVYFYSTLITIIALIVGSLFSNQLVAAQESPSFECLAAYSKAKGFNEPEFDKVDYDSNRDDCTQAIGKFASKVRSDIIEKMSEVSTDKKQTACINEKFTSDDTFVNNIIKGEALASLDDKEKSEKLQGIEKFAEEFITSAISACLELADEQEEISNTPEN
jgi:hypothetical protein